MAYTDADRKRSLRLDLSGEIEAAIAKAKANAFASVVEMNSAIVALVDAGVPVDEIEIIAEPHRGPAAWRVRQRRKVCDCGRAV